MLKTARQTKIGKSLATAALGLALALGGSAANASEHCKDVTITVVNQTGNGAQVYDMQYYDFGAGKWRNEVTRNRVLGTGQSWSYRKRLEKVGAERTQIKIKYRTASGGKWKVKHQAFSATSTCYRGSTYRIYLR